MNACYVKDMLGYLSYVAVVFGFARVTRASKAMSVAFVGRSLPKASFTEVRANTMAGCMRRTKLESLRH